MTLFFQSCFSQSLLYSFIFAGLQDLVALFLQSCLCEVVFVELVYSQLQVFFAFLCRHGFVLFHPYGSISTVQFVHRIVI